MTIVANQDLLRDAEQGIRSYLEGQRVAGRIVGTYYEEAAAKTFPNLRRWLEAEELDPISPNLRQTLQQAVSSGKWEQLVNAFAREASFGTGGIREKMGATREDVLRLKHEGVHAPIVKGPNTINDATLLLTAAGVARFGLDRQPEMSRVVIGFDSRVRGADFARLTAQLFLAYGYTVYLFDQACMYPSVTFAVPTLRADMGIFISASHNDFRYNGFKLSCRNGSQFDPAERDELYRDYIAQGSFSDIRLMPLTSAGEDQLWFLGGVRSHIGRRVEEGPHAGLPLADPLPAAEDPYAGRRDRILDLHTLHADHVRSFLLIPDVIRQAEKLLCIGYCAFNGAGREAVPRLLTEIGFRNVKRIMKLDPLDGMFPAFCSDPGREQQPDPGDWRAADIAVQAFQEEFPSNWEDVDLIIGTDPDADRCGVIVKVPAHQRQAYLHPGTGEPRDYTLLSADEVWSLILWYRLTRDVPEAAQPGDLERRFIALSHTTTELLACLARKHGLGVIRTWVGFAQLAAAIRAIWDLHEGKDTPGITRDGKLPVYHEGRLNPADEVVNRTIHSWEAMDDACRSFNAAAMEQSNGFSILGDVPPDERSLGREGHVRDKDGTFAAVLIAELAAYAKREGTNLIDLLDEKIYLDPDVGLFITHYEPDPLHGEYEGLSGYTRKRAVLDGAERLFASVGTGQVELGGFRVLGATAYRTGKYDRINWPGFSDEGYRFFFDESRRSHATIRPSGTSNALRFHVQLYGGQPVREELIALKAELRQAARNIVAEIRERIGARA